MGKRRKMSCLPSTSKAKAGDPPGPGNGGSSNQDPADDASLNPTTGSGNGGQVDPAPEANPKALMNPMHMPDILPHIFKFCSPEVLPSYRLVSKAWAAESWKAWRSSAILQFHYPGGSEIFLYSGTEENVVRTPLGEFLKFWAAHCSSKPFRRFKLSQWEFAMRGANMTTKGHMTNRFWKLTGSHMTTLILRDCIFADVKVLRKIILEACPNLQELTLDGCSRSGNLPHDHHLQMRPNEPEYYGPEHGVLDSLHSLSVYLKDREDRRSTSLPVSWLELLSYYPGLKSLAVSFQLEYTSHADYMDLIQQLVDAINVDLIQQLVDAIKLIRDHNMGQFQIQKLCIHLDPNMESIISTYYTFGDDEAHPGILPLLRQLNLPLELNFLKFNLSSGQDKMVAAMEIIISSRTVLQSLEIEEEVDDWFTHGWDFPFNTELPKLERLTMTYRLSPNMQFLKHTPNLKELCIMGERTRYQIDRLSLETQLVSQTIQAGGLADFRHLNLKELYFDFELNESDLRSLIGWLPNVEILTMYLDDAQFAIVCDLWRKLEHLHVLGGKLTDAGITGRSGMNSGEGDGAGADEILPNILYLTALKCFKIPCEVSELTDVSAFEGFLKLPALQSLSVTTSKNNLGKEAYAALHSKIPVCELCSVWRMPDSLLSIPTYPRFRCTS